MYWEEKIDRLKKETDPTDFKVPFTDWSTILKKIEDKFIIKENSKAFLIQPLSPSTIWRKMNWLTMLTNMAPMIKQVDMPFRNG